jgi:hypothetical protein
MTEINITRTERVRLRWMQAAVSHKVDEEDCDLGRGIKPSAIHRRFAAAGYFHRRISPVNPS